MTELRVNHKRRLDSLYRYTYDTLPNPFQGLFVVKDLAIFPFEVGIGPAFLSANNVTSAVKILKSGRRAEETYVPRTNPQDEETFYFLDYYCR